MAAGAPPPRAALPLELARELLARGLTCCYREGSTSMTPTIRPGDVVELGPATLEQLRPGDLVAVLRPEGLLVHRLVRRLESPGGPVLLLRGDARREADEPQPASRLFGRVVAVRRGGGRRRPARWPRWLLPWLRPLRIALAAAGGRRRRHSVERARE